MDGITMLVIVAYAVNILQLFVKYRRYNVVCKSVDDNLKIFLKIKLCRINIIKLYWIIVKKLIKQINLKNIKIKLNNIKSKYSLYKKIEIKHYYNIIIIWAGLGWAGPANWAGLSPKGLGWSRPNSSLCFFGLGRTRSRHHGWARTSLAQKKTKRGGGIIFPLPSSCMKNEYRSAYRRNLYRKWSKSGGERRVTWHRRGDALLVWLLRWRCCGGGRWRCRGSRTAAPSSGAAVSSGGERGYCSSIYFSRKPSPVSNSSSFLSLSLSLFPVCFPFLFLPFPFRFSMFFFHFSVFFLLL